MNAQDKELVLRIANECFYPGMQPNGDHYINFAARLKAAWLEQYGKGFEYWYSNEAPAEHPDHREFEFRMAKEAYQAGAASREPEVQELNKSIQALREELAEEEAIRERCAQLLAKTAVALKGEEAPLQRHGWQDLPEVAASVKAKLLASQAEAKGLREALSKPHHGMNVLEIFKALDEALSHPTNTEELDALVKDAEQRGFVSGLNEATRLVRMWLKDPDVERMTETARDACRKVNFWPGWLEQAAIDAAIKAQKRRRFDARQMEHAVRGRRRHAHYSLDESSR